MIGRVLWAGMFVLALLVSPVVLALLLVIAPTLFAGVFLLTFHQTGDAQAAWREAVNIVKPGRARA